MGRKKIIMKKLYLLGLLAMLSSCFPNDKEIYRSDIETYVISNKEKVCTRGCSYYIWFQSPTSTEQANVSEGTYAKYEIGDTIKVLIKYWEKPKK